MKKDSRNKKILIIEDDTPTRTVLSDKFSNEGFNVFKAKNAKEGLDIALKENPNLILLDLILPGMNGIKMLEILRADNWGRNVPVIILSNFNDSKTILEAFENNVSGFLIKGNQKINNVVNAVKKNIK